GLGATAKATSSDMPSFFVVQRASTHIKCNCFRSNETCIVIVPSPKALCRLMSEWCKMLLLLSGDVEQNPGPQTKTIDLVQEVLDALELIAADVRLIKENQSRFLPEDLERDPENQTKTKALIQKVLDAQERISIDVLLVKENHDRLSERIETMSRRNNIIVFGIPKQERETDEIIRKKVIKVLFQDRLGVDVQSVQRIHRLGAKKPEKTRLVIMKVYDYNEKSDVFRNCIKLKGTKISVSNDYSQVTLRKRKLLWNSAMAEKEQGAKIKLVHDKLRVNDDTYAWDDEKMPCKNR
ncbi:unnamed protein product, partial [Ixodes hexagonus]